MKALEPIHGRVSRSWLCWMALFTLACPAGLEAAYKVVLKDGKVLEARSKPVSMEGHLRFTDTQNQFHAIPVHLVDMNATQSQNTTERESQKSKATKVLTNEDISSKPSTATEGTRGPTASGSASQSKPEVLPGKPAPAARRDEAYWRGRAKQIRDETARVDKEIKALNDKIKSGKTDGFKIGFETYNSVIYANFESQAKELEKQKEKLLQMMLELEEEARKAGAEPGWLR